MSQESSNEDQDYVEEDGGDVSGAQKKKKIIQPFSEKGKKRRRKGRTREKSHRKSDYVIPTAKEDEEAEEVDEADAENESKNSYTFRITPLKKLVIKPDVEADEIFEGSFLPLAIEGEYTIGIMFVAVVVIDDRWMNKTLLGYEKEIPTAAETHTCEKETLFQAFSRIAQHKRNLNNKQKRELINETREKQKVLRKESELQPQIVKMYFALHQADKSMTPLGLDDLRSPEVVFRVKLRMMPGVFDEFGTFNFHRALVDPCEEFDRLQNVMEMAIPITRLETYRYCFLSATEKRGCLSSIPLLHNCAARFEFVSLATCAKPEKYSMDYNEFYVRKFFHAENEEDKDAEFEAKMRAAEEEEDKKAAEEVDKDSDDDNENNDDDGGNETDSDDILGDIYKETRMSPRNKIPPTEAEKKSARLMMGPAWMQGHNEDEDEDEDEDADRDDKLPSAANKEQESNGDDKMVEDTFENDVSALFDAALGNAPPPGMIDEEQKAEVMNRGVELSKLEIARLHNVHKLPESAAERMVTLSEMFDSIKRSLVLHQHKLSDFQRPLSARILWKSRNKKLRYSELDRRNLLTGPLPENYIDRSVLRMFAISMFTVMPRYVPAWSLEWGLEAPKPGAATFLDGEKAVEAINLFAQEGNLHLERYKKNFKPNSIKPKCLKVLGDSYPAALGFVVARNIATAKDFDSSIVLPLFGATKASLTFALYKNLPEASDEMFFITDDQTIQIRRYWSGVLPEQFWRVAVRIGFRGALHFLRLGAIDDVLLTLDGDWPHLAIFSRFFVAFRAPSPSSDAFMRIHGSAVSHAKKRSKTNTEVSKRDKIISMIQFQNTAHHFEGVNQEIVKPIKSMNKLPVILSSMSSDKDRRRLLSGVALALVDRYGLFTAEHYIDIFDSVLLAYNKLNSEERFLDTAILTPFVVRDREDLELFYPQRHECWFSVTDIYKRHPDDVVRTTLINYDAKFGINSKKERWAKEGSKRPVSTVVIQRSREYDIYRSIFKCITGEPFERYGTDLLRCDVLDRLFLRLIERLDYILNSEGLANVRLHIVMFPDAESYSDFDDFLFKYFGKYPHDLWDYVIFTPRIIASYEELSTIIEKAVVLTPKLNAARNRKFYLYFPRADLITHNQLQRALLFTTNNVLENISKKDWSWQDLRASMLPAENALHDAFMKHPLRIDEAIKAAMSEAIDAGLCGDYLYLSGLALHRGTFLGPQISGPSVFEDIFFACNPGDCCEAPQPGDVTKFAGARNRHARLRCWTDYVLEQRLLPMEQRLVIVESGVEGEPDLAIKFVSSKHSEQEQLFEAVQMQTTNLQVSKQSPSNVWLDTEDGFICGIDGETRKSEFAIKRSRDNDLVIQRRVGVLDRSRTRANARLSRFIFAEFVPDSDIIFIRDTEGQSVVEKSCAYENLLSEAKKRRTTKKQPEDQNLATLSISEARDKAIGAPSLAQMSSALRETETTWLEPRVESRANGVQDEQDVALENPSPDDLCVNLAAMRGCLLRDPVPKTRLEAFRNVTETWECQLAARLMPTRGFSIRELIAALADRPEEIVIAGTWPVVKNRLFGTPVKPDLFLATEMENFKLKNDPPFVGALGVLDCYALNFITAFPFMANAELANGEEARVLHQIIASAAKEN